MVRNSELKRDLQELGHRLDLIQTVIMVSSPESPVAAEAYEGLRRTVVQSMSATKVLHSALAQLDILAHTTDDITLIRAKLAELLMHAGIDKVARFDDRPDAFERIGDGPDFKATRPAYVTTLELPPVAMGVAETISPLGSSNPGGAEAPGDGDALASSEATQADEAGNGESV
jgi:hypothetical protein